MEIDHDFSDKKFNFRFSIFKMSFFVDSTVLIFSFVKLKVNTDYLFNTELQQQLTARENFKSKNQAGKDCKIFKKLKIHGD